MPRSLQVLFTAALTAAAIAQPPAHKPVLSAAAARAVAAKAVGEAVKAGAGGAVAVVDDGGNLLHLERIDGTFPAASRIAEGKARTAALFRRSTSFFEQLVNDKGRTTMVALPDFTPLQGGVPLVLDGQVVGAVGVSGANSAAQDDELAHAAAAAIPACCAAPAAPGGAASAAAAAVTHIDHDHVAEAFAAGRPLLETDHFKIHASRRSAPGKAEVHDAETDIIYVLRGQATLVTGGRVVGGERIAAGELRGTAIEDGREQRLSEGDVVVVPAGTPHWFKEVPGTFLYYVVKV